MATTALLPLPEMRLSVQEQAHPHVLTTYIYPTACDHPDLDPEEQADLQLMKPHLEPEGLQVLTEHLKRSTTYLEYGSGGSTILAAQLGVPQILSVESDYDWANQVQVQLHLLRPQVSTTLLLQVNIGPVGAWGYPVSTSHIASWPQYYTKVWQKGVTVDHLARPELVLIDGRFRIPCLLYSMLHATAGTTILFDDYTDARYDIQRSVIEDFPVWPPDLLKPLGIHGRMAEFKVPHFSDRQRSALLALLMERMFLVD